MTQEEKLLLKDLCARLPHRVIGEYSWKGNEPYDRELTGSLYDELNSSWSSTKDSKFIPYLRPMSSMTEEEKKELKNLFDAEEVTSDSICYLEGGTLVEYLSHISYSFCSKIIDWLNKHHFDYRGLIEKELAIVVTKENNPYKEYSYE